MQIQILLYSLLFVEKFKMAELRCFHYLFNDFIIFNKFQLIKIRYKECVKECDTNIYEYLIEVNGYIDT